MRFQNTSAVQFPQSPANAAAFAVAANMGLDSVTIQAIDPRSGVKRASCNSPSGATSILIPGSRRLTIELLQLVFSWSGVTAAGHFEVRTHAQDPIYLYQGGRGGEVVMPCYKEQIFLSRYGMRVLNNSAGGDYAVFCYYNILGV